MVRRAGRRPEWTARKLAMLLLGLGALSAIAPAGAHARAGGELTERKLTERQLRVLESRFLGVDHAADHAAQRRAGRRARGKRVRRRVLARAAVSGAPSEIGAWEGGARPLMSNGLPSGIKGVSAALLPTGKVLWSSTPRGSANEASAVLWDPATTTFKDVPPPTNPATGRPYNIFCSGISMMADGRMLITGGVLKPYTGPGHGWRGLDTTFTFDPFTERWQEHERMREARYYPSQLLMPDGRTFVVQGTDDSGDERDNLDLEVFDPSKPLGQETDLFGTLPTWARGDFYPHLFWMPSGRGMVAGPYPADSWFLQQGGTGGEALGLGFRAIDAANPAAVRTYGSAVLLPLGPDATTGEVVQYGGANDRVARPHLATETAEGYSEVTGRWTSQPSLNVARAHLNTVLLPDGAMVTIGGGVGDAAPNGKRTITEAHKQVELWDPTTRRWRLGPSQLEGRAYHSTAVLLPDGSVVSAGDDLNGGSDRDTYEIYKPPYFFKGPRPTISSAPGVMGYSGAFTVGSPNADIAKATLVAPSSVTHSVDANQRVVSLPVRRRADGSGYDVSAPASVNAVPPGYYMLFLVDTSGRPSVARWVRLAAGATSAPVAAPATQTPPATPATPTPATPAVQPPKAEPVRAVPPARPKLAAALRTSRLAAVRRTGRLELELRSDTALRAKLDVRLTQRASARARPRVVATWTRTIRFRRPGARRIVLRLSPSRRRDLRGDVRVAIAFAAPGVDGARPANVRARLR